MCIINELGPVVVGRFRPTLEKPTKSFRFLLSNQRKPRALTRAPTPNRISCCLAIPKKTTVAQSIIEERDSDYCSKQQEIMILRETA